MAIEVNYRRNQSIKRHLLLPNQSMVGLVMYAMIQTRPDICYAVTILSRYNYNLNPKYIAVVKRV